jgi:hypothetical protein
MGIFASKTWHFKHILRYSEVRYHLDMRRERCMNLKLHIKSRGLGVQAIEGGSDGSSTGLGKVGGVTIGECLS